MNTKTQGVTAMVILTFLLLAGCKVKVSSSSSFSTSSSSSSGSSSEMDLSDRRVMVRTHDAVTRKLEAPNGVEIKNGHVTKFPKASLVKIQETGGPEQREAELRENAGKPELWIKENGVFRRGSPEDDAWLERFLREFTTK